MPVTNTIITSWIVILLLLIGAAILGGRLKLLPGRVQSAVEMLFEYVFGYVRTSLGSDKLAKRYFPLIATIFVFILTANFFDFLPIFSAFTVSGAEGPVRSFIRFRPTSTRLWRSRLSPFW